MEDSKPDKSKDRINLSKYTTALINRLQTIQSKPKPAEFDRLTVSPTASFFAIFYEKIRTAVEYRETHLLRRAAVERIIKRRLLMNPQGKGEAENLLRELMWARYVPSDSVGEADVVVVQAILDRYLEIIEKRPEHSGFLLDLLSCEVEEVIAPVEAEKSSLETFFVFQVLKNKVKIESVAEENKDAYFYVALEKAFNKSDLPYLRYHLFKLYNEKLSMIASKRLATITSKLPDIFKQIDDLIRNPYSDRMNRFIKKQAPPFKILFETLNYKTKDTEKILNNSETLWITVDQICQQKYQQTAQRLRGLAIRAIIYIFLTKMILALVLEYPISLLLYHEVNYVALAINTLFPPLLMFLIVGMTSIPRASNTKRIYARIVDIIDADRSFEKGVSFVLREQRQRKPILIFFFTIFYSLTFIITFTLLFEILNLLSFNIISKLIFFFFVSLVAFFAYRIRQVAKEYQLREKEHFLRPFLDFFFMPFLSVGKFLSTGIAKINFIGVILDFLIEAPFKLIIEIIEEWINFVRARRDEIV